MMDSFLLIYSLVGIVFIIISIPLIKRKIKINSLYGVRLPGTMKDEKIWYEVNEKSAKYLLVLGVVIIVAASLLYFGGIFSQNISFIIMTAIILIGVIVLVIYAASITSKLNRSKRGE